MQSEYPHLPTQVSNKTHASETSNASQYGFLPSLLPSADPCAPLEEKQPSSSTYHVTSNMAEPQSDYDATVQEQVLGLKSGDSIDPRSKPSFQLTSEHEEALTPSLPTKEPRDGSNFKVFKKKENGADETHLDEFPNGMPLRRSSDLFSPNIVLKGFQRFSPIFYHIYQPRHFLWYRLFLDVSTVLSLHLTHGE